MSENKVYTEAYRLLESAGGDLSRYLEVRSQLRALGEKDASAVAQAYRDFDAKYKPTESKPAQPLVIFDGPFGWS